MAVDVPQTGRRDARYSDGACSGGLHRLLLADKPALTPCFAAGLAANMIGSGFLGAIVGGLIAGYLMRWVKNHIRLSSRYNGFLTFYLYPVIGVLGAGSLMLFVIGEPVAWINNALTAWLNGLSGANALLLGAIPALCARSIWAVRSTKPLTRSVWGRWPMAYTGLMRFLPPSKWYRPLP